MTTASSTIDNDVTGTAFRIEGKSSANQIELSLTFMMHLAIAVLRDLNWIGWEHVAGYRLEEDQGRGGQIIAKLGSVGCEVTTHTCTYANAPHMFGLREQYRIPHLTACIPTIVRPSWRIACIARCISMLADIPSETEQLLNEL